MNAIKTLLAQIDDQPAVLGTLAVVATTLASLGVLFVG